ncbi:WW domain protein [Cladophialophora carrionii]|uniref:WW domain protein n=1 Tax=Cladophialophora carrionii TaxID=86049 RepID=A0A1C1CAN1_9EURO|nr:WW domain protein [Cladophialophora carrionii]
MLPDKPEERAEDSPQSDEDGELKIYDHEPSPSTAVSTETTEKEATATPSANPPLPTSEEPPPLPKEGPPDQPADDGWAAVWDDGAQAFYFYNRFTQTTQWENPRVPQSSQAPQPSGPPGVENYASPVAASQAPPSRQVGGYDPAIHGDYDPNADYAKAYEISSAGDDSVGAVPGANTADMYEATGTFNRFTGKWQRADLNPEKFTDEQKSKRQMNAFFDVDAAANSHNGKSLRAERQSQKLTKAELKAFKEKRREKKEEKRRAWLRD